MLSMGKPKKEIHQPDDRLFKVVMSEDGSAAQYLITYHPELAEILDLSTLELQPDKFPIPDLKVFDADILYRCQLKNSKEQLLISFLWENKSRPDKSTFIQVGLYLFLKLRPLRKVENYTDLLNFSNLVNLNSLIIKRIKFIKSLRFSKLGFSEWPHYLIVKIEKRELEPVIPLIFYNGKEGWYPETLTQLFEDHSSFKLFEAYLPKFDFLFTDVTDVPREKLLTIEMAFFRSAMIAMANRHDFDVLFQEFSVIFDLDDEDYLIAIGHYVFGIYERLPERVRAEIEQFDIKIKSKIMSTLAILQERGKAEGIEIGLELAIKVIKLHNQSKPPADISEQLKIDVKKVKEIIKKLA